MVDIKNDKQVSWMEVMLKVKERQYAREAETWALVM